MRQLATINYWQKISENLINNRAQSKFQLFKNEKKNKGRGLAHTHKKRKPANAKKNAKMTDWRDGSVIKRNSIAAISYHQHIPYSFLISRSHFAK